mmetsp:Transcript_901/g.2216  ORF Transcript_901/g.2216 Transcript_901/m.2216 type:complete len:216 (+) Transcript_901:150-797(+)
MGASLGEPCGVAQLAQAAEAGRLARDGEAGVAATSEGSTSLATLVPSRGSGESSGSACKRGVSAGDASSSLAPWSMSNDPSDASAASERGDGSKCEGSSTSSSYCALPSGASAAAKHASCTGVAGLEASTLPARLFAGSGDALQASAAPPMLLARSSEFSTHPTWLLGRAEVSSSLLLQDPPSVGKAPTHGNPCKPPSAAPSGLALATGARVVST